MKLCTLDGAWLRLCMFVQACVTAAVVDVAAVMIDIDAVVIDVDSIVIDADATVIALAVSPMG